jgi:hypothetical protein
VIRKMLWRCFSLISFLILPNQISWCKASPEAGTHLTISVYNDVGVPRGTLRQAEDEATRIFRQAGIEVNWLNCEVPAAAEDAAACQEVVFPTHLHLRIVRMAHGLKEGTLGISFLSADGSGCQADLFYEPMEELQSSNNASLAPLLGHVAAHEVGHLLLGTNSHAPTGIMRAHWASEEISTAKLGGVFFSDRESERMRQKLSIRMDLAKTTSQVAAAR